MDFCESNTWTGSLLMQPNGSGGGADTCLFTIQAMIVRLAEDGGGLCCVLYCFRFKLLL